MQASRKSSLLTVEPFTPPQVYSPLPLRTPVVSCVDLALNNISNNEISLIDRDELYTRKFKCHKFLLEEFNDTTLDNR